ncbi:MAG: fadR [Firmicutes bacterium]|nr:fadR [Bacillota bacterium]
MNQTQAGHGTDEAKSKRQQILKAAYDVFSRKGYYRATVDEIIALADTGKGTVYNYFTNKEQLFCTLVQERGEPFAIALADTISSELLPMEKFKKIIKLILVLYIEDADLWRVLIHEVRGLGEDNHSNLSQETVMKYQDGFQHIIDNVEAVLKEGVDKAVFRPMNTTHVAYCLFSIILTMVYQKFIEDDIEITVHNIAEFVLRGITT